MNVIDLAALMFANASHGIQLATIMSQVHKDGRTELTGEEVATIRAATMASEARLEAATK